MRYPILLFDADNTLFDFDRAQSHALQLALTELNGYFEPHFLTTYAEVNHGFWQAFERGEISQSELKRQRFPAVIKQLGLSIDPVETNALYLKRLSESYFLLDGACELVERLAASHRLGLITNGLKDVQRPRFSASPITKHFEAIVISDELGIAKPDPGIFEALLELLGNPSKTDLLMIGDSLSSDIQGGINFGINTCWFNPNGKARGSMSPTHEISSLDQLDNIV